MMEDLRQTKRETLKNRLSISAFFVLLFLIINKYHYPRTSQPIFSNPITAIIGASISYGGLVNFPRIRKIAESGRNGQIYVKKIQTLLLFFFGMVINASDLYGGLGVGLIDYACYIVFGGFCTVLINFIIEIHDVYGLGNGFLLILLTSYVNMPIELSLKHVLLLLLICVSSSVYGYINVIDPFLSYSKCDSYLKRRVSKYNIFKIYPSNYILTSYILTERFIKSVAWSHPYAYEITFCIFSILQIGSLELIRVSENMSKSNLFLHGVPSGGATQFEIAKLYFFSVSILSLMYLLVFNIFGKDPLFGFLFILVSVCKSMSESVYSIYRMNNLNENDDE